MSGYFAAIRNRNQIKVISAKKKKLAHMAEKSRGCTSFSFDWVQWSKQCLQESAASLSIALTCSIFILASSDSFPWLQEGFQQLRVTWHFSALNLRQTLFFLCVSLLRHYHFLRKDSDWSCLDFVPTLGQLFCPWVPKVLGIPYS